MVISHFFPRLERTRLEKDKDKRETLLSGLREYYGFMSGVAHPNPSPIQGQSLAPALTETEHHLRDSLLIENGGIRRSIRTETALLTWHGPQTRGELYDLSDDPDCLVNLWDKPAAAKLQPRLLGELIHLMSANVDPLPLKEGPW